MHPNTCCLVRQEIRGKFSGAVEAFVRRNGSNSGLPGNHLRQRIFEDAPSSKDVHIDSERGHVSQTGSSSKRAAVSRIRPSSSGEPNDNRNGWLGSARYHLSAMRRLLTEFESESSTLSQPHPTGVVGDDTFQSFHLLTIGSTSKGTVVSHKRASSSGEPSDNRNGRLGSVGSTSKRAVVSHIRPSSSGEPSDNLNGRLGSGRDHLSTMRRLLTGFQSESSTLTQPHPTRVVHDDTFRSFDLLTISLGKRNDRKSQLFTV